MLKMNLKKFVFVPLSFFVLMVAAFPLTTQAKSKTYLYRNRANWVKLVDLKKKQIGDTVLLHPNKDISVEAMENMLLSVTLNRAAMFSKDVKEIGVFSVEEAKKYASFVIQALRQASPNQIVNFAVVHKRPHFIIRADYLSVINLYVTEDGVHLYCNKLFARLDGDYQQASKMDESIRQAKSARVTLKAMPGQKLSYNDEQEIIFDPQFDYAQGSILPRVEPIKSAHQLMEKKSSAPAHVSAQASANEAVKSRLTKLEDLKKSKLVSESEYQQKKKEILSAL